MISELSNASTNQNFLIQVICKGFKKNIYIFYKIISKVLALKICTILGCKKIKTIFIKIIVNNDNLQR